MNEMEKYRTRLQRKWDRRTTRFGAGGRRRIDYKSPPFFTLGFVVQFLTVIIGGLVLLLVAGCAAVKRTFLGG